MSATDTPLKPFATTRAGEPAPRWAIERNCVVVLSVMQDDQIWEAEKAGNPTYDYAPVIGLVATEEELEGVPDDALHEERQFMSCHEWGRIVAGTKPVSTPIQVCYGNGSDQFYLSLNEEEGYLFYESNGYALYSSLTPEEHEMPQEVRQSIGDSALAVLFALKEVLDNWVTPEGVNTPEQVLRSVVSQVEGLMEVRAL